MEPLTPRQWLNAMLTRFEREVQRLNVELSQETYDAMLKRIDGTSNLLRTRVTGTDRMD